MRVPRDCRYEITGQSEQASKMSDLPASSLLYRRHIQDRVAAVMRPLLHESRGRFRCLSRARTSTSSTAHKERPRPSGWAIGASLEGLRSRFAPEAGRSHARVFPPSRQWRDIEIWVE